MIFYIYKIIIFFLIFSLQDLSAALQDSDDAGSLESRTNFYAIIKYYEQQIKNDPNNLKLIIAVADVYYSLKEYEKAIEFYQRALALDPQNIKIKTSLALAYLNNHDLEHSQALLEQIFKLQPNNPDVLGGLGRVEALKHHLPQAEHLYQEALAKDPNHFTTLFYFAELKIDEKQYAEAQTILEKLLKENPQASWVRQALKKAKQGPFFEEIDRLMNKGDYQTAISQYQKALSADPNNLELYLGFSKLYSQMGRYADALSILKEASKIYPKENSLRLATGFTYLEKRDLDRAEYYFELALENETGKSEALAGLGRITALKGDFKRAEELYQRAINLDPYDTLAISYLATLRMDQKQYEQAQHLFEKIYRLNPKAEWAKQAIDEAKMAPLLGTILEAEANNDFVKAEQLYNQLLIEFPHNTNNYIRFANFYRSHKHYQKAIEVALRGLQIDPHAMPIYVALGYNYLLNGEFEKSSHIFKFVLDKDPLNAEAIAGLGRLSVMMGDDTDALDFYQWALAINPKDMTALSYLIDLRMEQKNYNEAQKLLQKLLKIQPNAGWAKESLFKAKYGNRFDEIKALEDSGDLYAALDKYQELLKLAPESVDVYEGLGRIYTKLKQYQDALQLYKKGLKLNPQANQLRVDMGLNYISMKELKKARQILQTANKMDPNNAEAIAALGRIAALMGDQDTAQKMYQTALSINPDSLLTLSYLAEFWMKEKQFSKAQAIYRKILKIDPKAGWAKVALEEAKYAPVLLEGSDKEKNKDYASAESIYLQLIEQSPQNADYYIKLGQLYIKMKRYQEAVVLFQQGLHIIPNSEELKIALGFAYLAKGDLDIGKNIFEIVLKNHPKNAEALAGIGRFHELKGNISQAINWYKKALNIDPNNITALIYLAESLVEFGQYADAQKLYQRIYELQPDAHWVKLAIEDAKHGRLIVEIKKNVAAENYVIAEILYKQLLAEAPDTGDYYLRFGLFYHFIKQYEKAIDMFQKGLKIDPKSTELYSALGLVYISKKDFDDARNAFIMSLKLDPKNPDALAGLGYVDMVHGQYSQAEELIKAGLAVDPNRIAALSSLGELWMREKHYLDAQKVYEKLLVLRPKDKWIKLSLDDAKNGNELDKIKALIDQEQYAEAAKGYQDLLEKSPNNPRYYVGLGQMYMRLKEYSRSIETNLIGLEKNPEENELRIALGYAYFFSNNLTKAREVLTKAVQIDAKDPEALAGLGRVNALDEDYCEAEVWYKKALAVDPKNQSALSFYGDLLMKQRRYSEAQDIFVSLWRILPDAVWVQRAWQNAVDGPLTDIANRLSDKEEFELARDVYRQLVASAPDDPARYLPLGQMYVNLQEYCCGIQVFEQGLMVDPEAWYLWREIAFTYIYLEEFSTSQNIFEFLTSLDSDDAESWAGLGRIQALNGSICLAERYYAAALEIAPRDLLTLSFLAELRQDEQYYFSALDVYETINQIVISDQMGRCEPKPKWVTRGYNKALNLTSPTLNVGGAYHEEDQWDPTLHRWSAEYLVYGAKALINYPICDELTLWGSGADQFYRLKDLINRDNIYFFDVQRFYIGGKWTYSPCFFIDVRAGFTNFSPYSYSTFKMYHGNIAEPTLLFTYHEPTQKATLGVSSGSDLVARNFTKNVAKLVPYYFLTGTYERKIIRRGWIGFEGDAYWYCDFVNNNSQKALAWFQWRPPYYPDNIIFRYFIKYQTFAKNIPDYYTYKPQIVNQLQVTLEKAWRVCWADTFYTSLSYGHGWQDTHTRFSQIIVIAPVATVQPFIWDRRQFNILFGTLIYKYDRVQFTFAADYYRDTQKYTIWTVAGDLTWRF